MDTSTPENGMQPNTEYEDQFVWDDAAQAPTDNPMEDIAMEQTKEAGEKRKAMESDLELSKSSKKAVILNVTYNNATDIKEIIKERGEKALNHETGYKTAVKIKWVLPGACAEFNVHITIKKLINKLIQESPTLYMQSSVSAAEWKTPKDIPKKAEFTKELD
eukprot:14318336-Ditylum_brightwellii.AAC.1